MRLLIALILLLLPCPFSQVIAPPATEPTLAPAAPSILSPHVEISADVTTVRVGETITLTAVPVNLGLPIYTLTLSSGAAASVTYDDQPRDPPAPEATEQDALFEIVAAHGEMNRAAFTLRALAPGSATAVVSATGEARSPEGAFMWSRGASQTVTLVISK
ncbi:MAG: hypothetical protein IT319_11130 [Anaerolineae bacterium]|nr:hypothetical protein [Anaerolineae bacterium]